jgi:hypothetical protein
MDAGSSVLTRVLIGIRGRCFNWLFVEAAALALMLVLIGCGGDDEERAATGTESQPAPTATGAPEPPTSPEDLPGGAGDEEAAESLAMFTGEGGRIIPSRVRVPAFISIRVELRSGDGRRYGLTFEGESIAVGGGLGSVSTTIDGLRPGEAVVGTPEGASNRVRIEATAEPGP